MYNKINEDSSLEQRIVKIGADTENVKYFITSKELEYGKGCKDGVIYLACIYKGSEYSNGGTCGFVTSRDGGIDENQ